MTKNIIVSDEQGNEYEATYPKRAKGLIKNGRARFVGENKICLACPPDMISEDEKMLDKLQNSEIINTAAEQTEPVSVSPEETKLTADYILEQLEKIAAGIEYLNKAVTEIGQLQESTEFPMSPEKFVTKAEAISDVVKCRETTNQQLIRLYEKMYDDLKPKTPSLKDKLLEAGIEAMKYGVLEEFSSFAGELRHAE